MDSVYKNLEPVYGKVAVYKFTLPEGNLEINQYEIEDGLPRSYQLEFWEEGEAYLNIEGRKGKWFLPLTFGDNDDLESFVETYLNLEEEANSSRIINDGQCLAGCGFYAGLSGFCSIHNKYNPTLFKEKHSNELKEQYRYKVREVIKFSKDPCPNFEYPLCDGNVVQFKFHKLIDP